MKPYEFLMVLNGTGLKTIGILKGLKRAQAGEPYAFFKDLNGTGLETIRIPTGFKWPRLGSPMNS